MDPALLRLKHTAEGSPPKVPRSVLGMNRGFILVGIISLVYVLTQAYVYYFPSYDYSTFLVGAAIPFLASVSLPIVARRKVLLLASVGFYWSLVEDGPVYLDSVFTWPEVTRFNPAAPHLFLEVLYHVLTAVFFILALREAGRGIALERRELIAVTLLTFCAFVSAYAQNIPLSEIQNFVEMNWFLLDFIEHLLSAILLFVAIKVVIGSKGTFPVLPTR
jgi:hypothetical protein